MSKSPRTSKASAAKPLPATAKPRRPRKEADLPSPQHELIGTATNQTLAGNPLVSVRAADLVGSAGYLLKALGQSPLKASAHLGGYLKELRAIVGGSSTIAPDPKDKRFADPAWQSNVFLRGLLQSYLAGQGELNRFIESTDLPPLEKSRAQFVASLLADAVAPSNSPLTNPAALRKLVDTGGLSLARGIRHFAHDMLNKRGLPEQVDSTPFKVGENIATAKGEVVFRNEMFELLQFAPSTPNAFARPLVMSPPQINKYYAIDLSPEKSLIKWIQDSGVNLFVISWRNPTSEHRDWGLSEYALCLDQAVDVACQITGSPDVNMWGSCSGGITLAAYLGWLAARGEGHKVANTSWAVCVLDMPSALDDTTLGLFATPAALRAAKASSKRKGVLSGQDMARMFAWMRPNDLIWNYWVNNYLLGNKPPAFDILAWNNDTTRLPAQLHADYLDLVQQNPYSNPGTLTIAGESIDMTQVKVGAYVVGGTTDHITPWQGCYGTARLFGEDATYVLSNAGHLQSLVNPPGNPKSFYYAAPASSSDPETWLQNAGERQQGSWWSHWREWIQQRSGESLAAPKKSGSRKHPPLCPAPGTYVMER
ncbi:class II poly(R)-hydroxyalkanoic acid synthase [Metapseudomonas resinovorans]|uniref:alpha/beta fold hydrolase n=1 Tax=Metapseudomonas resinovorans TaxID=53412 RepID=UPI00098518F6|nr:alpha/beta fold hydrolase [Pseudomonas resinovorans]GLZ86497.1 class II poly(R)-hydroxyalkanoic acid synthase [Pseudomonas resinovorans]